MTLNTPFVSIIIPCYNVGKYLDNCLKSILAQSFTDIEIIIINDGSTDDTLSVINTFKEKDPRIVLIDKLNGGVSNARNDGIKVAKGEYILFVDGDDYLEVNACETLYGIIAENRTDLVLFGMNIIKTNKLIKRPLLMSKSFYSSWQEYYAELRIIPSYPFCKLMKREIILTNQVFFDTQLRLSEGLTYFLHFFPFCKTIRVLPDCLYNYIFSRQESATNSIGKWDYTIIDTIYQMEQYAQEHELIYNSMAFKNAVFGAAADFVLYKYPRKGAFSKTARSIIIKIINDNKFKKYLNEIAYSSGSLLKHRLSSMLLLNVPVFIYELILFGLFKIQEIVRNLKTMTKNSFENNK